MNSFSKTEVTPRWGQGRGEGEGQTPPERKVPNQTDRAAALILSALLLGHTNLWFYNPAKSGPQPATVLPICPQGSTRNTLQLRTHLERKVSLGSRAEREERMSKPREAGDWV